jgi:hypothetical protein
MNGFNPNRKSNINPDAVSDIDTYEMNKIMEWSIEKEILLVEWADIAQCYRWLNSHSHVKYTTLHAWFAIPVIILSTFTGTASFIQNTTVPYVKYIIGTISILIGILSTMQQFLKITELKENYRISAILWDKYSRNIRIELTKSPIERMNSGSFMKTARTEFDHLMETTPPISKSTIDDFKKIFQGQEGSDRRMSYDLLRRPDILDKITSADSNRNQWFKNNSTIDYELTKVPDLDSHKMKDLESLKKYYDDIPPKINTNEIITYNKTSDNGN